MLTIINISIDVIELSSATGNIVSPVAFILGSIRPHLYTKTVSLIGAHSKLALVDCSVWENDLLSEL